MHSIAISSVVFVCVFGGALLGLLLRRMLPDRHLTSDAKDVIKLSTGLVSTMAALVLGLLVASAKSSYDAQSTELTQLSTNVVMLDRVLARYGADAQVVRDLLRASVQRGIDRLWPPSDGGHADLAPMAVGDTLQDKLLELSPQDDPHRALKAQALAIATSGAQTRWLMYEQGAISVSLPLLVVLVLLAERDLHQLRPLRSRQPDRRRRPPRLRPLRIGRDLPDPGDVRALRGRHPDLQRSPARRARPPGPVGRRFDAASTTIRGRLLCEGTAAQRARYRLHDLVDVDVSVAVGVERLAGAAGNRCRGGC